MGIVNHVEPAEYAEYLEAIHAAHLQNLEAGKVESRATVCQMRRLTGRAWHKLDNHTRALLMFAIWDFCDLADGCPIVLTNGKHARIVYR
jgi:hypothetical protein